jgi:hypothetical protein
MYAQRLKLPLGLSREPAEWSKPLLSDAEGEGGAKWKIRRVLASIVRPFVRLTVHGSRLSMNGASFVLVSIYKKNAVGDTGNANK